jgi:3-oxoacyl-[acyl-carrier protein] reductase
VDKLGLLVGKVALITGAGKGIGRGVARRFTKEGAKVVIAEIDVEAGNALEAELRQAGAEALFIHTNVAIKAEVERAVEETVSHFGGIDILVNNAIKPPRQELMEDKTDEMLAEQLGIGVWGTWWFMQTARPYMCERGAGRIINFSSIDVDAGSWLHSDYSVAKAGIQAMTRSAAMDWGRYNITVNCITPTAITTAFEEMCKKRPELKEKAEKDRPICRLGDPENDIAPIVVMLATDAAGYVTGATIPVDGGKHLGRGMNRPDALLPPRG